MPTPTPQYSKDWRFFQEVGETCLKPSGHTTRPVKKMKNEKRWVLKEFANPLLPQVEAGMAALYQLFKPSQTPKVRAVYKTTDAVDSAYFATVSKVLPDFMDFEYFLGNNFGVVGHEAESNKTLDFLIHNGFPESCALSYFLEEDDFHKGNIGVSDGKVTRIDFDMSGFSIVSQSHLRGSRVYSSSTFPITTRDLSNFPVLTDAMLYYWPTVHRSLSAKHGYAASEAQLFSSLEHNDVFVGKSYLTFLKIILMLDAAIKAALAAHISDAATLEVVQNHFVARKAELKSQLLACAKFQTWFKKESLSEIQSIFQEIRDANVKLKKERHRNLHVDVDAVAASFRQFSREMAKEKIEGVLLTLAELIKSYRSETAVIAASSSVDIYSTLVAVRDFLFAAYKSFRDKPIISADDMAEFVKKTNTALKGLKTYSESFPLKLRDKLGVFFQNSESLIHQLQRDQTACLCGEVSGISSPVYQVDLPILQDCTFMHVPTLDPHELVRDTVVWLRKPDNKSMVMALFKSACEEYERRIATTTSQIVSGMYSGIASAYSWFVAKPAAVVDTTVTASPELNAIFMEMGAVESPDRLCQLISRLLSETKPWSAIICEYFVLGLINQFSREFSAKHIVEQMQKNPDFAEYLKAQPNNQVESTKAIEIARLMIAEMQPQSEDSDEFNGCVIVHSSGILV